jgi:predicted enzyme related to lactoylglutathione lyase
MMVDQFVVGVNSEQPEKLIAFYRDTVGLTPGPAPGAFLAGSSSFFALIIGDHSELRGVAKEPQRVLLNFFVGDVASEEARLKQQGVEFIKSATKHPGATIATFLDPDGNYCQLLQLGS